MRKIYLLIFSFLVFLLSLSFFPSKIYAQTKDLSASSSSQQENRVDYELPYPGLLPDSPLYFLRAIRDKVVSLLISDSLKKTKFDLLQADKRLNAGIYLFNKGKASLSLSTISKAENYFSEAIDKLGEAENQRESISEIKGKMKDSLEKHEEELNILIGRASGNFSQSFKEELKRVTNFEERLNQ